jgi:putative membrane protein
MKNFEEESGMRESKRVYCVAALAAACALTLTAFMAGAATPGRGQNNNNGGSNANANGNAGGNTNANARNANGNTGGQTGATGRGQTGAGQGGTLGSADRQFMTRAAMMDMAEIQTGRLAVSQGASESVRQFGQRMIDDHTRTSQQLMQMASAAGFTPPQTLDEKHQAAAAKLSGLTGAEFDRAYMKQMVKDHQEAVSLYQRQSTRGTMPELRSFASATLPALQEHLTMARSIAGGSGGGSMNHNGNSNSGGGGNASGNSNSNR